MNKKKSRYMHSMPAYNVWWTSAPTLGSIGQPSGSKFLAHMNDPDPLFEFLIELQDGSVVSSTDLLADAPGSRWEIVL